MIRPRIITILALWLAWGPAASIAHAEDGDGLTVRVLTIAPGDHPLFTLGQSAIWIQDERAGRGFVYDFGPVKPDSIPSRLAWLAGRLENRVSRLPIDEALEAYRREDRQVETQDLYLPPAARAALQRELELATLPANRDYRYDPFLSGSAIRVREAVDRAAGGRVRAAASRGRATGPTLRQQALDGTRDRFPAYLLVDLALGPGADRPLLTWDQTFTPRALQQALRQTGRAGSWNNPPLVASEGTIVAGRPDPSPQTAGPAGTRLLLTGLVLGALLGLGGWAARRWRSLRSVFAVSMGTIGLLLGLLGIALVVRSFFGAHLPDGRNENILQLAPWGVVLPGLVAGVAAGRAGSARRAFWIATAAAAFAAVGLLLKATPWFHQDNLRLIGLFLPVWAGVAVGLRPLCRE